MKMMGVVNAYEEDSRHNNEDNLGEDGGYMTPTNSGSDGAKKRSEEGAVQRASGAHVEIETFVIVFAIATMMALV